MSIREHRKLVRDKIPEIIESKGECVLLKILSDQEYDNALSEKLLEEATEVINATAKEDITEELADLLEVIYAKAKVNGISILEVELARERKKLEKGGFDKKIYLINTASKKYVDEHRGCANCVNDECYFPMDEVHDGMFEEPAGHYCLDYKSPYGKK